MRYPLDEKDANLIRAEHEKEMAEEKINYFDTPIQRRKNGGRVQKFLNALLGFGYDGDEDETQEERREYEREYPFKHR